MSDKMSNRSPSKKDLGPHQSSCQGFRWQGFATNLSGITYFNYHQKGHYGMQCLKPSKGFNVFDDLSCNKPGCNDPSCDDSSSESDAPNSAIQDQDPQV